MLTVLTPTGARPEAFAACVDMMAAQDYDRPVRWVIVDDGPEPMPTPTIYGWEVLHVRPFPLWKPGDNTQSRNMLFGLQFATERVAIVEDDDAYADWWLAKCDEWLNSHDLVGESNSIYVHKNGNEKLCNNRKHASLCSTAVKGAGVDALRQACINGPKFIDMALWKSFTGPKALYPPSPRGVTGIKGWPGRPGIGAGHRL